MEKIKINTIIEIAGAPEEHVKETIDKMMGILKKNEKIEIIKQEVAPPKKNEVAHPNDPKQKVDVFSSFAELELDFPTLDELIQFCFVFMPSSIEVIEPQEIKVKQKDLENPLNDLLAKLHNQARVIMEYDALRKQIMAMQQQKANSSQKED
ncbi:hypothetical protein HOG16_00615 [Candidatus Woesearchaeota archaeon]|jgi:hypothetical protein|nr:hypothetical protein [Candidatus Woesearchaeota archaeon]MBT4321794.1 hypothetical protein [Candidatus Woesearchaeota archaeon]